MDFWNRSFELDQIKGHLDRGGFGFITGRRRVGKTALLKEACKRFGGIYHQAVEGAPGQQIVHFAEEVSDRLTIFKDIVPKTWGEFFRVLSREKLPRLLVFDEFPYWVQGDPTLPSFFQKWIDHDLEDKGALILTSGSSQSMLYSQFLNHSSPLYGRSTLRIHLEQMDYKWFCQVLGYRVEDPLSFERFSLVGGVPHYWKILPKGSLIKQAESLYFEPSAILAEEPINLLRDEGVTGTIPKAILDLVGRGVSKPSEFASRLGTVQGNLSRPLSLLLELGLVHRDLPFGESPGTTKRVIYTVQDPVLAFYYGTFLPFRSRWSFLAKGEKERAIHRHASFQWENFCRRAYPGSGRYWESGVEIDLVAPVKGGHLVAECKWADLKGDEERVLLADLERRFNETSLKKGLGEVVFKVFSQKDLAVLQDTPVAP